MDDHRAVVFDRGRVTAEDQIGAIELELALAPSGLGLARSRGNEALCWSSKPRSNRGRGEALGGSWPPRAERRSGARQDPRSPSPGGAQGRHDASSSDVISADDYDVSLVVHAWTLVLRNDALEDRYPGGLGSFEAVVPNASFHCDDHLAGVSFMSYADVKRFGLKVLDTSDLVGFVDGSWCDLVPVDQIDGPNARCDWLELEKHADGYTHCWLSGTAPGELVAYSGWTPESSQELQSYLSSELEPVTIWHASPQEAFDAGGARAAMVKETGDIVYY